MRCFGVREMGKTQNWRGATARSGRGKTKEGDLLGREGWGVVHCADGAERSGERHGELTPLGLGDDR